MNETIGGMWVGEQCSKIHKLMSVQGASGTSHIIYGQAFPLSVEQKGSILMRELIMISLCNEVKAEQ